MSDPQTRAREHLPQVLLGVLGILQALALELLWEQGVGGLARWDAIDARAAGVLQIACMFLGIVVVWLMYASLVLRFSWVPRFQDLVVPFVIGVLEFGLIGAMGPERVPWFLGLLAVVFLVSAGTNYGIYRVILEGSRAAEDAFSSAGAGYLPSALTVLWLIIATPLSLWAGPASLWTLLFLGGGLLGLAAQIHTFWRFWSTTFDRVRRDDRA